MSKQGTDKAQGHMPEFCRKCIVSLKRQPSMIPFLIFIIAFVYYTLNLSHVSDTTAKIQGAGMGLCEFAVVLFSLLSLMCFMNSFPRRQKPVIPMLVLGACMVAIILYCDYYYSGAIMFALNRPDNPIVLDANTIYIAQAYNMISGHMMILVVGVVVTVLIPVYSKLLNKINTSYMVDDYGDIGAIDISGED